MSIFVDQMKNLIVLLLAAAGGLSFIFGQWLEGASILVALLINVLIGFFTELRAVRSMEALQKLGQTRSTVVRDGRERRVASHRLVPGDLVVLQSGDVVAADIRLLETRRLQTDESALTGESAAVDKQDAAVDAEAAVADKRNMAYKGTSVLQGSAKGIVVATGMATELGRISALVAEAEPEETPLEQRLNDLGRKLIWVTLGIAAAVIVVGLLHHRDTLLIIETAIALAVAAIPEGLPIVATIALARGMWRMAAHQAVVNRLSAVETLGSTNTICTDKTGTLTENRMEVSRLLFLSSAGEDAQQIRIDRSDEEATFQQEGQSVDASDHRLLATVLEIGCLCNNASMDDEREEGDPEEVALLKAADWAGLSRDDLLEENPRVDERPFDPDVKMMATFHRNRSGLRVAVKGAPEAVLDACRGMRTPDGEERKLSDSERRSWLTATEETAAQGLRMLAMAEKRSKQESVEPFEDLTLVGLVGFLDPPRRGIEEVIARLRGAGIRVIMVTGDQAMTARNIALRLGLIEDEDASVVQGEELQPPEKLDRRQARELLDTAVFARISPEQKLDLVSLFQESGSIVAMTGDGVNDAPALQKADIGVAMGRRGTQVAREAADVVLRDDSFRTISAAVEHGRTIFNNIRRFVIYLLSGNVGEIMIVAFAMLAGAPLPLLPLQILYLNVISDVFPALALGLGKGQPGVMNRPPRDRDEPIITSQHWLGILGYGLLISASVLAAFWLALDRYDMSQESAVATAFLTLAFARTWHVLNMRDRASGLFVNEVTRNPYVWIAILISLGLLLAAILLEPLASVLKLAPPTFLGWRLILGFSAVPLLVVQVTKGLWRS